MQEELTTNDNDYHQFIQKGGEIIDDAELGAKFCNTVDEQMNEISRRTDHLHSVLGELETSLSSLRDMSVGFQASLAEVDAIVQSLKERIDALPSPVGFHLEWVREQSCNVKVGDGLLRFG